MEFQMMKGGCLDVVEARTKADLHRELGRFNDRFGFRTYTAMVVIEGIGEHTYFYSAENPPDGYIESYSDPSLGQIDPVMQHCKRSSLPLVWGQSTYVDSSLGHLWEHQASFGYHTGIALSIHLLKGRHFFIGIDRDRPLSTRPHVRSHLLLELQAFAVHAQEAAFRILAPGSEIATASMEMSAFEVEALRWTMDGKSPRDIASILKLPEMTVTLHLCSAVRRLNCVTKHEAVLKAIRLGLMA